MIFGRSVPALRFGCGALCPEESVAEIETSLFEVVRTEYLLGSAGFLEGLGLGAVELLAKFFLAAREYSSEVLAQDFRF